MLYECYAYESQVRALGLRGLAKILSLRYLLKGVKMIYKKINDFSVSQLYELQDCIKALYKMLPLDVEDCDEVWFHNRFRYILECILTDEAFDRLFLGVEPLVIYKRDGTARVVNEKKGVKDE